MTIEKRTKTITKDFYIAKDGKEFEDRERCMKYEHELIVNSLKMFDKNFCKTTKLNDAWYVYLGTWEELDEFKECCDYYWEDDGNILNIGFHAWDDDKEIYVNIDDEIEKYAKIKRELKKLC